MVQKIPLKIPRKQDFAFRQERFRDAIVLAETKSMFVVLHISKCLFVCVWIIQSEMLNARWCLFLPFLLFSLEMVCFHYPWHVFLSVPLLFSSSLCVVPHCITTENNLKSSRPTLFAFLMHIDSFIVDDLSVHVRIVCNL